MSRGKVDLHFHVAINAIIYCADSSLLCSEKKANDVGPRLTIKFEITCSLPYLCQAGTDF